MMMTMMMTIIDHHHYQGSRSLSGLLKKISTLRSHRQSENSLFVILRSLLNRTCALIGTKAKITLKHISERDGPVLESAPV